MPTYEISLLLRKMQRPALVQSVKRTAELLMDRGGYIRQVEHLGTRALPARFSAHGQRHTEGSYFRLEFDMPPSRLEDIVDGTKRDVDVVRFGIYKLDQTEPLACSFHEETEPAPYRADVRKMVKAADEKEARRIKFKPNTKLDFYPFQR